MSIEKGPLVQIKIRNRPKQGKKIIARRLKSGIYQYTLVNAADLRAGDEIRIVEKNVKLRLGGTLVARPKGNQKLIALHDSGKLFLNAGPGARSRMVIRITRPPVVDPREVELVGPDLYAGHADPHNIPLRDWIIRFDKAGFNYWRDVLPAHAWNPATKFRPIWRVLPDGRCDLECLDYEYMLQLRADLWFATQRKIVAHIDLFDYHILRGFPGVFERSEFCGLNNTFRYPLPDEHYRPSRPENTIEHALKGAPDHPAGHDYAETILRGWREFVIGYMPPGHIVGDANESTSRTLSRTILSQSRYPTKAYGGEPLRRDGGAESAIPYLLKDRKLFEQCSFICLHGSDLDTMQALFYRVQPLLKRYSHLKVLFSTDGARRKPNPTSEQFREQIGRVPLADLPRITERGRLIAGSRFGGGPADLKQHGLMDILEVLAYYRNRNK